VQKVQDFNGVPFSNIVKADLDIQISSGTSSISSQVQQLAPWWERQLQSMKAIDAVRVSSRLSSTPCIIVTSKCDSSCTWCTSEKRGTVSNDLFQSQQSIQLPVAREV
jgi:HSP90 family molecular chaperone